MSMGKRKGKRNKQTKQPNFRGTWNNNTFEKQEILETKIMIFWKQGNKGNVPCEGTGMLTKSRRVLIHF